MAQQDEFFMRLAIKEARNSKEPLKCGVVIAKEGEIIAQTHNSQRLDNNATAHAEIKAIKEAGKIMGNKNLSGCSIYCTCEPCIMCLSAISFAKIEKLFFGTSLKDVSPKEKRIDISVNEFLDSSPHRIGVVENFLQKECDSLLPAS